MGESLSCIFSCKGLSGPGITPFSPFPGRVFNDCFGWPARIHRSQSRLFAERLGKAGAERVGLAVNVWQVDGLDSLSACSVHIIRNPMVSEIFNSVTLSISSSYPLFLSPFTTPPRQIAIFTATSMDASGENPLHNFFPTTFLTKSMASARYTSCSLQGNRPSSSASAVTALHTPEGSIRWMNRSSWTSDGDPIQHYIAYM